ncbi:MAG: hypothetical protein H8E09_00815 [Gammaproteobacteria bacterium]|nr:hypothetical protein [Gammaproteobacteria bacterium]
MNDKKKNIEESQYKTVETGRRYIKYLMAYLLRTENSPAHTSTSEQNTIKNNSDTKTK